MKVKLESDSKGLHAPRTTVADLWTDLGAPGELRIRAYSRPELLGLGLHYGIVCHPQ